MAASDGFTPPYIPFQTFIGFLDRLAANDIPPRIDRTVMGNMSGTTQSYLLATLRSLGLIGENLEVRPELEMLALKESERPRLVGDILNRYYAVQIELGSKTATSGQLAESFREFGLSGETVRKAIRFFLHAADYAGIKLSPYFKTPTAAVLGQKGGRKRARMARGEAPAPAPHSTPEALSGHSQTVGLDSGGTVTLNVSVNLFDLSTKDRKFVLGLVDAIREYAESLSAEDTPDDEEPSESP